MTHVTQNVVQQQFRGRNDDGSETAATWKAATNTNWTQPTGEKFRVRLTIEEIAGGAANNYSYVLEYSINGGAWTSMATTGPIHSSPSNFVTNGIPTTQQISTGSFVAGQFDDNSSVSNISLTNQVTEMEYCLLIDSATINNGDTIQLRATNNGTALDGYNATPTITVLKVQAAITADMAAQEAADTFAADVTVQDFHGVFLNTTQTMAGAVQQTVETWSDTLITWDPVQGALPLDTWLELAVRNPDGEVGWSPVQVMLVLGQAVGPTIVFMGSGA